MDVKRTHVWAVAMLALAWVVAGALWALGVVGDFMCGVLLVSSACMLMIVTEEPTEHRPRRAGGLPLEHPIVEVLDRHWSADVAAGRRAILSQCPCAVELDFDDAFRGRGLARGQVADFRWRLVDGRSLHGQLMADGSWEWHLDSGYPGDARGLVQHLSRDLTARCYPLDPLEKRTCARG